MLLENLCKLLVSELATLIGVEDFGTSVSPNGFSGDEQVVVVDYSLAAVNEADAREYPLAFINNRSEESLVRPTHRGEEFGLGVMHYQSTISAEGKTIGMMGEQSLDLQKGAPPTAYTYDRQPYCDVTADDLQQRLSTNKWVTLSLPCELPADASLNSLFGDDITGEYGQQWIVYSYEVNLAGIPAYRQVDLNERLEPGEDFWIITTQGDTILDMPAGSRSLDTGFGRTNNCTAKGGCMDIPLRNAKGTDTGWNLTGAGISRRYTVYANDLRFVTREGVCTGWILLAFARATPAGRGPGGKGCDANGQVQAKPTEPERRSAIGWAQCLRRVNGRDI